jgi:hypothetical protein
MTGSGCADDVFPGLLSFFISTAQCYQCQQLVCLLLQVLERCCGFLFCFFLACFLQRQFQGLLALVR